jgi:hypothetical protein
VATCSALSAVRNSGDFAGRILSRLSSPPERHAETKLSVDRHALAVTGWERVAQAGRGPGARLAMARLPMHDGHAHIVTQGPGPRTAVTANTSGVGPSHSGPRHLGPARCAWHCH